MIVKSVCEKDTASITIIIISREKSLPIVLKMRTLHYPLQLVLSIRILEIIIMFPIAFHRMVSSKKAIKATTAPHQISPG